MKGIYAILSVAEKILDGQEISLGEALELSQTKEEAMPFLFAGADLIRRRWSGEAVDTCAIVNARSGRCTEDCKYCAQSKHHQTNVRVYPLLTKEELLLKAKEAEVGGACRFAIVTSGKGMDGDKEFEKILSAIEKIHNETNLKLCCSLGELTPETAEALKAAGVTRYHHNVETNRGRYGSICTTHTYEDRIKTIAIAREAGLEICSGGILGMGESMKERLEMAFEIKEIGVHSVPLNLLCPIPGTPLAHQAPLNPLEILKTYALFRFILPRCSIRTAGGREANLRDLQSQALTSGISGIMVGGYLTTGGRDYADDMRMLSDLNRPLAK